MMNYSKKFQHLPPLKPDSLIPFSSESEFSMHELMAHLLSLTGPASVRVSSFSITEVAIRTFANLMESGNITSLNCLFDISVKRHKLGLLYFIQNVGITVSLAKCHAKLILIRNEDWNLVVVGSANFQVNDKIEAGVIFSSLEVFDYFSGRYDSWFNKGMLLSPDEFN